MSEAKKQIEAEFVAFKAVCKALDGIDQEASARILMSAAILLDVPLSMDAREPN